MNKSNLKLISQIDNKSWNCMSKSKTGKENGETLRISSNISRLILHISACKCLTSPTIIKSNKNSINNLVIGPSLWILELKSKSLNQNNGSLLEAISINMPIQSMNTTSKQKSSKMLIKQPNSSEKCQKTINKAYSS